MLRIPKTIHCCWLGSSDLPDHAKRCMDSWVKYLPDYEIKIWNENIIDFSDCPYAVEAFEHKKWAFLSDYIRLKVLHEHGGVYFDTDVEVIKSFDSLLMHKAFMGFESSSALCTAVIGAEKGNELIAQLLHCYLRRNFVLPSGEFDYTTNVMMITQHAASHWGLQLGDKAQILDCGLTVFPSCAFSPIDYHTGMMQSTNDSFSIHHFTGSWLSSTDHKLFLRKRKFVKIFGKHLGVFLDKVLNHISWRLRLLFRKSPNPF